MNSIEYIVEVDSIREAYIEAYIEAYKKGYDDGCLDDQGGGSGDLDYDAQKSADQYIKRTAREEKRHE